MKLPNFKYEKKLWSAGYKLVAGLDEVGRGALAGPVVTGAVIFAPKILKGIKIDDSKRLTPKQREKAERWIRENALATAVSAISAKRIGKVGISKRTHSGFRRVVKDLQDRLKGR